MTGGVPLSEPRGGVPGGVRTVSREPVRDKRFARSTDFRFGACWPSIAFLLICTSGWVVKLRLGGSRSAVLRPVGRSCNCRVASAVAGRLSGLAELSLFPERLEELFLDLKTPLMRPTGDGDLLLDWEAGGARPARFGDPEGSSSPRGSVVDVSSEGRDPW